MILFCWVSEVDDTACWVTEVDDIVSKRSCFGERLIYFVAYTYMSKRFQGCAICSQKINVLQHVPVLLEASCA